MITAVIVLFSVAGFCVDYAMVIPIFAIVIRVVYHTITDINVNVVLIVIIFIAVDIFAVVIVFIAVDVVVVVDVIDSISVVVFVVVIVVVFVVVVRYELQEEGLRHMGTHLAQIKSSMRCEHVQHVWWKS